MSRRSSSPVTSLARQTLLGRGPLLTASPSCPTLTCPHPHPPRISLIAPAPIHRIIVVTPSTPRGASSASARPLSSRGASGRSSW
eukprot:8841454-Pyramimonas_sp.AAC.1